MHPTIDNGAVIHSPMHDSGGGVQQHVNTMLTSIAIAEQIDIVSITFQDVTKKYLKLSIHLVFVKVISALFKIPERITHEITSAIGRLFDSFLDPLRSMVLTITEEEERLELAPVERPATTLFLELTDYHEEAGNIVGELRESVVKSLPSIPDMFFVLANSIILEFFSSLESVISNIFSNPVNAITIFIRSVFSVIVSLIGLIIAIIPSPHEKYPPWVYLPSIRLLFSRVEPYIESLAETILSPFARFIIFLFNLPIISSIGKWIETIAVKICHVLRDVTVLLKDLFVTVLRTVTPLIEGMVNTFYGIVLVFIRGIVVIYYTIYFWSYSFFRTAVPAKKLSSLLEGAMEMASITIPAKIAITTYRKILSFVRMVISL